MLVQGILLGISLSFLIGPLLFAIVEAGISQGFRAGVSVASGIWASDLLYVCVAFFGIGEMEALVALPHFKMWAGIAGGCLLFGFGFASFLKAQQPLDLYDHLNLDIKATKSRQKTYLWWWMRGFLVNTINPGTLFFWLGIVSAVVVPNGWKRAEMLVFFGGMLSTLILTDILKALAAKALRKFLTPTHIRQIQRGLGLLLMVFGLGLFSRSIFF